MKVLVLGAYGMIGSACVMELKRQGFDVVGVGRSAASARRAMLDVEWIISDVRDLAPDDWRRHLAGCDAVVNAAGALQDGARDGLEAVHETAVKTLCDAAQGGKLRFVQISAAGVSEGASTEFLRSKARGDAHVQASDLDWTILRPTLVIGPNAYGGTALLRGVAGFPGVGARVMEDSLVQTVHVDELARAVARCALGKAPSRQIYDVTEPEGRSFAETVALMRAWLGYPPFALQLPVPRLLINLTGRIADGLGRLGWRSPLRTTALRTLADGVTGDPTAWRDAGGEDFSSLPATLSNMRATLQERWFARLFLLLPVSIAILSVFWIVSGAVGLWQMDRAVQLLTERGFDPALGHAAVVAGSIGDLLLGALILYRPWAKRACLGMVMLALGYMVAAALFAPDLWADPLGPMVKVVPSIGLALLTFAMLEER